LNTSQYVFIYKVNRLHSN